MPENIIRGCHFDHNNGAGFYAQSRGSPSGIADAFILDSIFNANGASGFYQIDLERSAGFHIMNNQLYGSPTGDLRAKGAGSLKILGNDFDGSANINKGGIVESVVITAGGWGTVIITGNTFHIQATSLSGSSNWVMLSLTENAHSGMAVTGNSFYSSSIPVKSVVVGGRFPTTITESGNSFSPLSPTP